MAIGNQQRLQSLNFAVRSAVESPLFVPKDSEEVLIEKLQTQKSFSVFCKKCGPFVPTATKEFRVGVATTSNMMHHLRKHHSAAIAEEFKLWLEDKRAEFSRLNPTRKRETRVSTTAQSLQTQLDNLIVKFILKTMAPLRTIEHQEFEDILNFFNVSKFGAHDNESPCSREQNPRTPCTASGPLARPHEQDKLGGENSRHLVRKPEKFSGCNCSLD